ncbi:hypothetical protein [Polaribacter glomeratus]|nr:hypothetical protein [Polaribacter glomeratus]TXD66225.1 hypothetical protein ESX12_05400 [Polaribacter glomeratus]
MKNKTNSLLILEKPHFPSPEKDALFFFSGTYSFDLYTYFGKVKEVQKIHSIYNLAQAIVSSDTVFFESKKKYLINLDISKKPIKDLIGIDSVSKKTDTIQLFHFDEDASYVYQVYELKNEQIINSSENTNVLYYSTDYSYDKHKKLIKIATTDDYGVEEIETATYDKNGLLTSKNSFDTNDGINVVRTNYTYKNKLLTKVEKKEVLYFLPTELNKTTIDKIDYSQYENDETFINRTILNFEYHKNNRLHKVEEISSAFSKKDGVQYKNTRTFTLEYQPNKLVIYANLPERRTYEYIFDAFKNPKEINSFIIKKDKTWLHKKTTFKILYDE